MKQLLDLKPYDGFDHSKYKLDLQGWNGNKAWLNKTVLNRKPDVIIEVGSWKGQSAVNMGKALKKNKKGKIICVDHFMGSPEHYLSKHKSSLRLKNAYPNLYFQFLANIIKSDLKDFVVPFPNTSRTCSILLKEWDIKADMIYIDASHDYESAKEDIKSFLPLLKKGGIMCGDDYAWEGVKKAVDEVFKNKAKLVDNTLWYIEP